MGRKQLLGHNLFSYCKNVVISKKDLNGKTSDEEDWFISDYIDIIDNEVIVLIDKSYYQISIKEGMRGTSTYVHGDRVHTAYKYDQTTTGKKQLFYTGQYDASSGTFTFLYENDMVSVSKDLVDYTIGYDYNYVFSNELLARNDDGSYSVAVERLQIALMEEGYSDVIQDGIGYFGPNTQDAVAKFQLREGLDVDGKAGPDTKHRLYPAYVYAESQFQ